PARAVAGERRVDAADARGGRSHAFGNADQAGRLHAQERPAGSVANSRRRLDRLPRMQPNLRWVPKLARAGIQRLHSSIPAAFRYCRSTNRSAGGAGAAIAPTSLIRASTRLTAGRLISPRFGRTFLPGWRYGAKISRATSPESLPVS